MPPAHAAKKPAAAIATPPAAPPATRIPISLAVQLLAAFEATPLALLPSIGNASPVSKLRDTNKTNQNVKETLKIAL
jgi:hypothetical protein